MNNQCEQLIRAIAPELIQPVYTIFGCNRPHSDRVLAFAQTTMDAATKQRLIGASRWQGVGFVVRFVQSLSLADTLGVLLHELAHFAPFTSPPQDVPADASKRQFQEMAIAACLNPVHVERAERPHWSPNHDWRFIRAALHLHRRAWQKGYEIGLPEVNIAGEQYGLSPAYRYMHALESELRRTSMTFAKIHLARPPRAFRRLWRRDVAEWWTNRRNDNAKCA